MKLRAGLVLMVGVLIAADAKDDATKKDMEKIQGTWVAVAAEQDGKAAPKKEIESMRVVFMGDKFVTTHGKEKIEVAFKLDAGKKPKTIDVITKHRNEEHTVLGIYQLQGDELIICTLTSEKERPKEFKTAKGSRTGVLTLKREKK